MKSLFRFVGILRTLIRYRLDHLILSTSFLKSLRPLIYLTPWHYFPSKKLTRGERIRLALEELGPIFIKFGQTLSTRRDLLPDDIGMELAKLQDKCPPFPAAESKLIIEKALGDKTSILFSSFDDSPLASASIAQVHTAVTQNGEEIIIKVVRPGIEKQIKRDISLLYALASLAEKHSDGKRLRPKEAVEEFEGIIYNELNMMVEAANASLLGKNFNNSDLLYVPKVHWDLCRSNILVTERIYGTPVNDIEALKKKNVDFKSLAEDGVIIFFTQVFDHNFFHADMHPGNIFVSKVNVDQPSYIAIDCAIVGSLSKDDQYNLARMLQATLKQDYYKLSELFIGAGWVSSQTNKADLEQTLRATCEPIFEKPLSEIEFGNLLLYLFDSTRQFGLSVQPSLILLQKTLIHIEGMGREIYADLDFWGLAEPYLDQWIDKQFSPLKLKEFLENNHYEILDKASSLPGEIFNLLDNIKFIANDGKKNIDLIKSLEANLQNQRKWQNLTILTLIGIIMILIGTMLT